LPYVVGREHAVQACAHQHIMLQPLPPPTYDPAAAREDEEETMPLCNAELVRQQSANAELVVQNRDATTLDTRTEKMLTHKLKQLTFLQPPAVHPYPAPDVVPPAGDPTLFHHRPPVTGFMGARISYLDRFLNSSMGRFSIFMSTCALFNLGIFGFTSFNKPEYRVTGESFYLFWMAAVSFLSPYTIPLLAKRAGMNALESGWKPYLVLWRISFVTAGIACVLQVQGSGEQNGFGLSSGAPGDLKLEQLNNDFWNYFELKDGFVGLNLTKGVVETLAPGEHGVPAHRRFSRFRDAELSINKEPYSDNVEPTETPGMLSTYRIAPVFANWAPCVANYRISSRCLELNPVRAWAVSTSTSLCSRYKSVGCKPPKPFLEPVYQCSQAGGVRGIETTNPVQGFCGHVAKAPPDGAIDELGALLLYDSWPKVSLPKPSTLWLDVSPDSCINDPALCEASWSQLYLAGLAFQILTNIFILISAFCDCRVDYKIRKARYFVDKQEKALRAGLPVSAPVGKFQM